ncbi:uncharacterized protein LOC135849442 isoform X2 [Planococcus citri]|uniref:uncharacterized protein LOC135849442 isoform X2 n=1 Tax=Planococcus citri TaxID=170843 RepID=UPI0031F7CD9B
MTEITSQVYDIFHQTPVSLKQLSAIAVGLGIWRCKLNHYRTNDGLSNFRPKIERNSLKAMLPNLPSAIIDVIYEYVVKFGSSLNSWLYRHYDKVFIFRDRFRNEILGDFDDFVCDHDGNIHHTRTAERLMHCSALKECEKFRIACTYFFEDHIRLIWPNVRRLKVMNYAAEARFDQYPQLYYWICYLKNEQNKISIPTTLLSIDELMFDQCLSDNRPSVEYFWFRIPLERRLLKAFDLFDCNKNAFLKFILQKLDDQQLDEFVERKGCDLMIFLSRSDYLDKGLFLPTWKYIKSRMSDGNLSNLVLKMLKHEASSFEIYSNSTLKHWSFFCSEIWHSINTDLKPSIVESVLSRHELFDAQRTYGFYFPNPITYPARYVELLSIILSCATFEQKRPFWLNCWRPLFKGARVKDLRRIVELCFENEEEIAEFKKNTIASISFGIVRDCGVPSLLNGDFDELNALADFCSLDSESARILKQEILRSFFLEQSSFLNPDIIKNANGFRVFVDDVFNNAGLSTDFKNQLISLPENQEKLTRFLCSWDVPFEALMKFFVLFAVTEQTAMQIKIRAKNHLIELSSNPRFHTRDGVGVFVKRLDQILLWCWGSDEEIAIFKRTYSGTFRLPHSLERVGLSTA